MVIFLTGLADGLCKAMSSGIGKLETQRLLLNEDSEKMIGVLSIDQDTVSAVLKLDNNAKPLTFKHSFVNVASADENLDIAYFVIDEHSPLP